MKLTPVCTDSSAAADEPLIGSAPDAVAWVCLEQPGPWGRKAFTDSHLDPELGAAIEHAAGAAGVRPALIRRPGRHADAAGAHTVLVAFTHPTGSWMLTGTVADPTALTGLDWDAVARGDRDAVRASLPALGPSSEPQLLVCTNGTRDTCCALLGRPVALAAADAAPRRVWEVTHTSGHRFAPTTVLLPSGYLHGRLLDATPVLHAADAGELALDGLRGRSTWPAPAQAAEELVRRSHGITGIDVLTVSPAGGDWLVTHVDGRAWTVAVTTKVEGERAESCGKVLKPVVRQVATAG
jgi:hypothetical protein